MLARLAIRNVLLIESLDLEFGKGLNVLTGETGAGKSILLDCLGFVLGWRGRADLVREGANQGEVIAEFELASDHKAFKLLEESDVAHEGELIIRRVNSKDGRKRGYINDRSVSGEFLRQIGETLVEMHGQHDDKGLLDESSHSLILDKYAAVDLTDMSYLYRQYVSAVKALKSFDETAEKLQRDSDYIRHASEELNTLAPRKGEAVELDEKRRSLKQAYQHGNAIQNLEKALSADEGVSAKLGSLLRESESLAGEFEAPELESLIGFLGEANERIYEAENVLSILADKFQFDPLELEKVEERLFALRALARKHNVTEDELPELAERLDEQNNNIGDLEGSRRKLLEELRQKEVEAQTKANQLHEQRIQAAKKLDAEIVGELAPLKLDQAEFKTEIDLQTLSKTGLDNVRFSVKTNPGMPYGSLSKIASGGELSRFLLALKLSLHQDEDGLSMIFDEIDRGVGGATAAAVGSRLRLLSKSAQLLVVTHSPQVAGFGQVHFRVEKHQTSEMTTTKVSALSDKERIDEIARMISGDEISQEALGAARKLIEAGNV